MIRSISASAMFHFKKPWIDGTGTKLPCTFPSVSTEWTPPAPPCESGTGYTTSVPADWDVPEWQDLLQGARYPGDHYFQYRAETAPDGQSITIMARGDLDCDGAWSDLSVVLEGHQDPLQCWVSGNLHLIAIDPYE